MGVLEIKARRTINDFAVFHWEASVGARTRTPSSRAFSETPLRGLEMAPRVEMLPEGQGPSAAEVQGQATPDTGFQALDTLRDL